MDSIPETLLFFPDEETYNNISRVTSPNADQSQEAPATENLKSTNQSDVADEQCPEAGDQTGPSMDEAGDVGTNKRGSRGSTALFVGCLSTVQISMLKSMMRKLNPSQSRYSVLSNLVLHENICRFFGSVLCASIYYVSLGDYRQLIFFVLAGVNVITVLLFIILFIGSRHLRYQGYEKI